MSDNDADGEMSPEDWAAYWTLQGQLREVQKRGAPKLGEEVVRDGKRYVCTDIRTDGSVGYVPIPDGMTADDLGRKYPSKPMLWEKV